eukprot:ANDGO_07863.mRNA.1 Zinc finger A20 and AN1 domain-containing stress-associated protein 4
MNSDKETKSIRSSSDPFSNTLSTHQSDVYSPSSPVPIPQPSNAQGGAMDGSVDSGSSPSSFGGSPSSMKKKGVRCGVCAAKVGLATGFKCKCGGLFCGSHRYPDTHVCSFDHKAEDRRKLAEANPVVIASKITAI